MSNYTLLNMRDRLARLDGVGDVSLFGAREYAMRIWLDPNRIAALGLTAGEVVQALRAQNVQVVGRRPAGPAALDASKAPTRWASSCSAASPTRRSSGVC